MSDSALILLAYAVQHPGETRSLREISDVTGIPYRTINHLMTDRRHITDSVAYAHGYYYRVRSEAWSSWGDQRRVIEAVRDASIRINELERMYAR